MKLKVFFDCEFIEGFHKPLFGKRRHFIDLISIGMITEDGREYHAVSNEYKYSDASDWVRENVIRKEYNNLSDDVKELCSETDFHLFVGKSNAQIAEEIVKFVGGYYFYKAPCSGCGEYRVDHEVEFLTYFGAYDWVLMCSLFGTMENLPKGFPYYSTDIKQMMDHAGLSAEWKDEKCPEPSNAHMALVDAIENKKLFHAIQSHQLKVVRTEEQEANRGIA